MSVMIVSDNSHATHVLSSTFRPGLLLLEGRLGPFPFLALGNEDGLRPSGPLMLPGAGAVPGSPNSADTDYVKYDITIGRGISHCHISGNTNTT